MKYLKLIGLILLFLLLYYVVQTALFMVIGIIESVKLMLDGQQLNPDSIVEIISGSMGLVIFLSGIITFLLYMLIYKIRKRNIFTTCGFSSVGFGKLFTIGLFGIALNLFTVTTLYTTSIYKYFPEHSELIEALIGNNSFIVTLLTVGIIAPLFEEILFRGMIYNELKEHMKVNAVIVIQALLFAIYHMNILQGLYAFVLGIFLGLVYRWYKSIWAPIAIHVLYNSTSVVISRVLGDAFISQYGLYILIFSLFALAGFTFVLYKGRTVDLQQVCEPAE
ncbi:MAG: CPBP family intramembrane glutamic endopeptidase [Bacillota bacterium]